MPRKPRQKAVGRLSLVRAPGTPDQVVALLHGELAEAENDEVLAVAVIKVKREGIVEASYVGHQDGFRHQLVAGCHYLLRDLGEE